MDEEIREALEGLSVPLWPTAGRALGLGRNSSYKAYVRGEILGAYRIGNKIRVPTAFLRHRLGLRATGRCRRETSDPSILSSVVCDATPHSESEGQ